MNDGDKALVVQDEVIINVAKRDMEGVVPLYYEMTKAKDEPLTPDKIFLALTSAYKANIGIISNEITKIWNSDVPNVDAVKWLCMYNNFVIDYAKTLFLPEKPEHVEEELKKFSKSKLPHFFKYAKDKEEAQTTSLNDSTVNKLYNIIPNKPIQFKKVAGNFDYKMLMNNHRVIQNEDIINTFVKLNRNKRFYINTNDFSIDGFLQLIKDELSEYSHSTSYIVDVLISYLYKRDSASKDTLWNCYGDVIYRNLENNLGNTFSCQRCNERHEKKKNKQIYCPECAVEVDRIKARERKQRNKA